MPEGLDDQARHPQCVQHLPAKDLDEMAFSHALPEGWHLMDYWDFLEARRPLIARVVRKAWEGLRATGEAAGPREGLAPGVTRAPEHWTVEELITRQESDRIEFKSAARWDYRRGEKSRDIEDAIVKTVAAFMNSRSGTPIIGVDDDGNVLGLQKDLATVRNGNLDGFDQWLHTLLSHSIGTADTTELVSISFVQIDSADLCRVDVRASGREVCAKTSTAEGVFSVRTGAATQALGNREALDYIRRH